MTGSGGVRPDRYDGTARVPAGGAPPLTPAKGLAGVGDRTPRRRTRRPLGMAITRVGLSLAIAFGALAAGAGYWQVVQSPPLSIRPDNPAVVVAARNAVRAPILDRAGAWLARSEEDAQGEPYRVYRARSIAPVVGYASRQYGTAGLERTYDSQLVGISRPDPVSDVLKKFDRNPYDPQTLQLTLSLRLQTAAVEALGQDRGAVVILQPQTGEVLALASTPTYDASAIANPETAEATFSELANDEERKPLLPRATQGQYVPGSVFKIVTALAGLDSGAITPETTYEEQPEAETEGLLVSGFRVRDGHHLSTGDEELDLIGATEVSCNIWYAQTGMATGGDALAATAADLGFDGGVPFDLPVARSQLTNGGGEFGGGFKDVVELANASYGQAETLVTPFQMALVAAAVANDGALMEPHLVASLTGKDTEQTIGPREAARIVSPGNARAIQAAMQQAVESELGQRFTPGADVPGVSTAGKSGTAELGGTGEPHSWFIGFAPVEDPQVAIAVLVEQGGRGAERAAPIAGNMMGQTLALLEEG